MTRPESNPLCGLFVWPAQHSIGRVKDLCPLYLTKYFDESETLCWRDLAVSTSMKSRSTRMPALLAWCLSCITSDQSSSQATRAIISWQLWMLCYMPCFAMWQKLLDLSSISTTHLLITAMSIGFPFVHSHLLSYCSWPMSSSMKCSTLNSRCIIFPITSSLKNGSTRHWASPKRYGWQIINQCPSLNHLQLHHHPF